MLFDTLRGGGGTNEGEKLGTPLVAAAAVTDSISRAERKGTNLCSLEWDLWRGESIVNSFRP